MMSASFLRRAVVGFSVAALPLGGLTIASGAAQANANSYIDLSTELSDSDFTVVAAAGSQISPFAEGELLLLEYIDNGVRFIIDEGSPRLVTTDPNCRGGSASAPSTMIECRLAVPFLVDQVALVDFTFVTTAVAVAVEANSPLDVTYYGGSGKDEYYGGPGTDIAYGGAGNDSLFGGSGNDRLFGEVGDDYLEGESGNDRHYGGPGDDLIVSDDGQADSVVDCGGRKPSEGPDFDEGLDNVVNCTGSTPPPPPPAPVPPADPPAPGTSQVITPGGTLESRVEPGPGPGSFVVTTGEVPISLITPAPVNVPTVIVGGTIGLSSPPPPGSLSLGFQPNSSFTTILFSEPTPIGTSIVAADGSWSFEGVIPPGVPPGEHTLQVVGTDVNDEVLVINIGVEVSNDAPPATIFIEGTRGSGREINTIFVDGTATGLVGAVVIPRYKLPGQSEWQIGKARRTVAEDGTFAWKRKTGKKIQVSFISGDTASNTIRIPSRKKTIAER
jgi:hypothetical protein